MPGQIISRLRYAIGADTRPLRRELRRGERTIDDQERAIRRLMLTSNLVTQRFQRFQRSVVSLRGAFIGLAAVGGFLRLAQESTRAATALVELSDRTGFTTERLQTLGRVLEGDGASIEQFQSAIDRMSRSINDAGRRLSTPVDALEQIGLTFEDLADLNPEEQFDLIVQGFESLTTEAERAGVAQGIFGRSSTAFVNVLQRGSESLREQEDAFRQLGITTDRELRSLKELNQEFTNISTTLRVSLQEAFADSSDELRQLLINLQELIRTGTPVVIQGTQFATQALTSVSENTGAATGAVGGFLVGRGLAFLATQVATLSTAIGGVGGASGAIAAFATRLAAIAGPAGVIVGVLATFVTFRNQLADLGRYIGLLAPEAEPGRLGSDARASEIIDELIRLTNIQQRGVPRLFAEEIRDTPRFQIENREAITEFVRELEIGTENVEAIFQRISEVPRRDLRLSGQYEARLRDLQRAVNDGLQDVIDDLNERLVQRLQANNAEFLQRRTFEVPDTEDIDLSVLERQREEEQRLERIAERQRERKLAIVDAQQEILAFEEDAVLTGNQRLEVERRLNQLTLERSRLLQRQDALQFAGLTDEAEGLESQVSAFNLQIDRLQSGLDSFRYTGFNPTEEQQIAAIEQATLQFRQQVGRDGIRLFDNDNLSEANMLWISTVNTLGLFNEMNQNFETSLDNASFRLETIGNITQEWLTSMRDGLAQIIVFTDDWGQALERLGRLALTELISSVFTEDRLRTLFTGRQFGGYVNPYQPYIVGESGPELFVPSAAGNIIPNREISQGSVNITFSPVINSSDGPGVRAALREYLPLFRADLIKTISNSQTVSVARQRGI